VRRRPPARQAGFALVEVIVGAAIVAAMMALTYRSIAANASAARQVAERRQAVLLAQSVLAQATASPAAAALAQTGRDGALSWQVGRAPYPGPAGGLPIEQVAVRISAATGPVITLRTLRVVR
jgi:prepilin-type N-terminal cleavage/methylation domain-containing protein